MKRHKLLGYYIPAFFEMHIDTMREDMNINKMPIEDATVLFHEYIHFLQDISSCYGLNRIFVYSEYLRKMINEIYKMPNNDFNIPMALLNSDDNVKLNTDIIRLTEGDVADKPTISIKSIEMTEDKLCENEFLQSIPSIILKFADNDDIVTFGAGAISESMAYILEYLCSPTGYQKSPEYPYMAAEKVASYYDEEFAKDKLMILALCDMSLMSSNPGACFVRVMDGIKQGKLLFTSPEQIYDHFYQQKLQQVKGGEKALEEGFIELLDIVSKCLKSYLKIEEISDSYYQWIDSITSFVKDWRQNYRYFLLDMARQQELFSNNCLFACINRIGTPLMSNNISGSYFKIPISGAPTNKKMDVEYFKAIYQIDNDSLKI